MPLYGVGRYRRISSMTGSGRSSYFSGVAHTKGITHMPLRRPYDALNQILRLADGPNMNLVDLSTQGCGNYSILCMTDIPYWPVVLRNPDFMDCTTSRRITQLPWVR